MSTKIEGITDNTLEKIKETVNADTIIGKSITTPDGTVIVPVSKVTYGFAAGGSDLSSSKGESKDMFGGGSGAGVSIIPVAFLVISDGNVELLQIESFKGAIDRVIAMAPDAIDKIGKIIKKHKTKEEEVKEK